jgi:uroporphyrinogen decarboxylase
MTPAFTPVVYEHAARFVGRTPWDVSRDAKLLFEAHRRAYLEYRQQVIAVGIDIYNLEAEAYGARVVAEGEAIPAVRSPILGSLAAGLDLAPYDPARDGRIAMVLDVAQRLRREFPAADVRVPVAGPFSIAFNLRGIDRLCLDAALEPELTARVLLHLAENQAALCRAVAAAGLDVAFFESAAAPPILSPRQFRAVELPALRRTMALASECLGHAVPCILGGDTYPVVDDLLATGTGYLVCNVETDQRAFVDRVVSVRPEVTVRVNLDPLLLTSHDEDALRREVDRVLAVIAGRPQCVIGTGALPLETPPANVRLIGEHLARVRARDEGDRP